MAKAATQSFPLPPAKVQAYADNNGKPSASDTTGTLPGITPVPAPKVAAIDVVSPAATQESAPKKDRYLKPSQVVGFLAKILPKTTPDSDEFYAVLDAISICRNAAKAV
nr:hypothetical protein [uncultured Albidiferax sp.]